MITVLNKVSCSTHIQGYTKVIITDAKLPVKIPETRTIHLNHHKPGSIAIELDIITGYLYVTNQGSSSINYRLNNYPVLDHIQRKRAIALLIGDETTFYIPYISSSDDMSNNELLSICLHKDLSLAISLK